MDIIDELDRIQNKEAALQRRTVELEAEGHALSQMAATGSINIARLRKYESDRRVLEQDFKELLEEVAAILKPLEREDGDEA